MIFFQKTILVCVLWFLGFQQLSAQAPRPFPMGLPTCLEADFRELEKLYDATQGDNWTNHNNWFTANMSTWNGITLSPDSCDVYAINLQANHLVGTIPNLNLPQLYTLILSVNELSGSIPPLNLPQLAYLWLQNNQLSGSMPLLRTPNLLRLNFAFNQLSGNIPVFDAPNMVMITLNNNMLTGNIPDFALPRLQWIYLQNNLLSGNIPNFTATRLTAMSLDNNFFHFGNMEAGNLSMPKSFRYAPQKNILPLTRNNGILTADLAGSRLDSLTYRWYRDTNLMATIVGNNQFIPHQAGTYHYEVSHKSLTIWGNPVKQLILTSQNVVVTTPIITHPIPTGLKPCLYDDFVELDKLYTATHGDNWTNHNDWFSADMTLWTGIFLTADSCDVQRIDLAQRGLIGSIPNLNLPRLTYLNLGHNQLTGNIPNMAFPELDLLWLYKNQLTGNIPTLDCPKLSNLSLYNNQLTGNIPLLNYPFLNFLALNNNQLTGNIPLFNCPNLISLGLHNNLLTGAIPNLNLPRLTQLSLYNNQLTGNIPNFTNLSNMQVLQLQQNNLMGNIPNFNFPNLTYLDLSSNQLSGNIPNFNFANLNSFLLHRNLFKFGDMQNKVWLTHPRITTLKYAPQNTILPLAYSRSYLVANSAGCAPGTATFNWYKDGILLSSSSLNTYVLDNETGNYSYTVTHATITQPNNPDRNLIISSNSVYIVLHRALSGWMDVPLTSMQEQVHFFQTLPTASKTPLEKVVKMAPNPTSKLLTIDYQGFMPETIQIFNGMGQLQQIIKPVADGLILNMEDYGRGIYFVKVDEQLFKIVKE